jgi:hypothetical protein
MTIQFAQYQFSGLEKIQDAQCLMVIDMTLDTLVVYAIPESLKLLANHV